MADTLFRDRRAQGTEREDTTFRDLVAAGLMSPEQAQQLILQRSGVKPGMVVKPSLGGRFDPRLIPAQGQTFQPSLGTRWSPTLVDNGLRNGTLQISNSSPDAAAGDPDAMKKIAQPIKTALMIGSAINRLTGKGPMVGPPLPPDLVRMNQLNSNRFNTQSEFAKRALAAQKRGMQSGDPNMVRLQRRIGDNNFSYLARVNDLNEAKKQQAINGTSGGTTQTPTAPSMTATGGTGSLDFNEDWMDSIPVNVDGWFEDPTSLMLIALDANKIPPASPAGQRLLDLAKTAPNDYWSHVGPEVGDLAQDGSDFPLYMQGIIEKQLSPMSQSREVVNADRERAVATVQSVMAGEETPLTQTLRDEMDEAETDKSFDSTAATAFWSRVVAPYAANAMIPTQQLQGLSSRLDNLYAKWRAANMAGQTTSFLDYVRQDPGMQNYLQ